MLTPNNLHPTQPEDFAVAAAWEIPAEHSFARKLVMTLAKFVARLNPIFWMIFDVFAALLAVHYAFEFSPRATKIALEPSWTQLFIFPFAIVLGGHVTGLYERIMI